MKHDRTGGKRTNWLLIKHRDEFAGDGDGDAILADDRSVASGRPMADIAAGKGCGPKPFMLATKDAAGPDAVWDSNKGLASETRRQRRSAATPAKAAAPEVGLPEFIPPQLCQSVEWSPSSSGWLHEIKFDGHRWDYRR